MIIVTKYFLLWEKLTMTTNTSNVYQVVALNIIYFLLIIIK